MSGFDVVVIGAGPAGSAAAGLLALRGRRVLVLEKERFPRRKVCGEFLSAQAAEQLGALGLRAEIEVWAERIREGALFLRGGEEIAFRLPDPGLGVSRTRLDDRLARWAEDRGAELRFGARARGLTAVPEGFRVRFSEGPEDREIETRSVVGAWGRWDAMDREWRRDGGGRGRRFLAWSRGYEAADEVAGRVALYLFPGGYCGLSRVEGGRVHLAGIVDDATHRRLPHGWEAVVAHARASNPAFDRALDRLMPATDFHGAGPVYLAAKPPAEGGVLMVGDSAGVLDPFSGQGIACALSSGILAAQTLETAFAGAVPFDRVARVYAAAWRARFRSRFGWSAVFRLLVHRGRLAETAARWAGARLVRSALQRLAPEAGESGVAS
jgi:flavin-dependent dehydrogenase